MFFDDGTEKVFSEYSRAEHEFIYRNSIGLRYEPEEVRKCIQAGKIESEKISHNESLVIIRIADEIRRQIGVKYSVDSEWNWLICQNEMNSLKINEKKKETKISIFWKVIEVSNIVATAVYALENDLKTKLRPSTWFWAPSLPLFLHRAIANHCF